MSHKQDLQNTKFIPLIGGLRIKLSSKSRFLIPLCRLIPLHVMRPIVEIDVQRLKRNKLGMVIERMIEYYMYLHMTNMKILLIYGMQTLRENTNNLPINHLRKSLNMTRIMKDILLKYSWFRRVTVG